MKCYHLLLFTLTILLSYYVAVSFAQTPRRGRIKFGGDHDDIDIQQSDKIATIENPIAEQSRTSSRFRPRTLTSTSTTGRTTRSPVEPVSTTKKFQSSRTRSTKRNEQPEKKPSSRQARTFSARSTDATGKVNTPAPSVTPVSTPPKFNGGRRRIEKSTTKEPAIGDIEQENYPQHFKEHVKSKQPYQPKIKHRPAAFKAPTTTTTTSERPQIVEVVSQSSRKSLFKPRVKIEKPKVTTSSTTTSTTSRTTRSAVRTKVYFPQRPEIEKSTADNEIYDNIPTEKEFPTTRNKFSAKFSTTSPVLRKNEDALSNSKFPPASQKFSSKYRSDSLSYSLSKTERGRQAYTPTVPPVASESKNQPVHIYPEKMMQMVFDEAAGVWNMVEIVPNGLTRSEIIVDTGDGRTQELDDQQGSSATISIYSALADILTKNAPPMTTTTTTTTSTTTQLPEIIKVSSTESSTAEANFITTTVYNHQQNTNFNNNSGLLAGNLLQATTSVDPNPTTTTATNTTPSELTDINTTILPSNDSNWEFPYIPPTNIPPPILADILTTPGSDLVTQPRLIDALTNILESNATNTSDVTTTNTSNLTTTNPSNLTTTNGNNESSKNYYSVVTYEPVTISFVDLFTIKPKRVKVMTNDEVQVPESTTVPVNINPVYKDSENEIFFTTVTNELESLDEETTTVYNTPPTAPTQHELPLNPANLPTSTYQSRFGNNRLSILPPTTSSTSTSTTTTTTTKPRYKNRVEGILDFAVYGILPNKTVVRKKPTPKGRSLGLVVYGVLPNNTFVQKFSNGTMIAVDMSSDIEVLDIDPEMLLNPNSELYRTSTPLPSSTTTTTTGFSDNNQIEVTSNPLTPDSESLFQTTAANANTFEGYEDNLLNSSNGVLEKMDNPVLLDILKRNYIKGNGKGSKSVFSLTTAKSAIDSSTVSSNDVFDDIFGNEKTSLENTLNDSTESHESDDNFILKHSNNPVLETAITDENDVFFGNYEKSSLRPSERGSRNVFTHNNVFDNPNYKRNITRLTLVKNGSTKLFPINHSFTSLLRNLTNISTVVTNTQTVAGYDVNADVETDSSDEEIEEYDEDVGISSSTVQTTNSMMSSGSGNMHDNINSDNVFVQSSKTGTLSEEVADVFDTDFDRLSNPFAGPGTVNNREEVSVNKSENSENKTITVDSQDSKASQDLTNGQQSLDFSSSKDSITIIPDHRYVHELGVSVTTEDLRDSYSQSTGEVSNENGQASGNKESILVVPAYINVTSNEGLESNGSTQNSSHGTTPNLSTLQAEVSFPIAEEVSSAEEENSKINSEYEHSLVTQKVSSAQENTFNTLSVVELGNSSAVDGFIDSNSSLVDTSSHQYHSSETKTIRLQENTENSQPVLQTGSIDVEKETSPSALEEVHSAEEGIFQGDLDLISPQEESYSEENTSNIFSVVKYGNRSSVESNSSLTGVSSYQSSSSDTSFNKENNPSITPEESSDFENRFNQSSIIRVPVFKNENNDSLLGLINLESVTSEGMSGTQGAVTNLESKVADGSTYSGISDVNFENKSESINLNQLVTSQTSGESTRFDESQNPNYPYFKVSEEDNRTISQDSDSRVHDSSEENIRNSQNITYVVVNRGHKGDMNSEKGSSNVEVDIEYNKVGDRVQESEDYSQGSKHISVLVSETTENLVDNLSDKEFASVSVTSNASENPSSKETSDNLENKGIFRELGNHNLKHESSFHSTVDDSTIIHQTTENHKDSFEIDGQSKLLGKESIPSRGFISNSSEEEHSYHSKEIIGNSFNKTYVTLHRGHHREPVSTETPNVAQEKGSDQSFELGNTQNKGYVSINRGSASEDSHINSESDTPANKKSSVDEEFNSSQDDLKDHQVISSVFNENLGTRKESNSSQDDLKDHQVISSVSYENLGTRKESNSSQDDLKDHQVISSVSYENLGTRQESVSVTFEDSSSNDTSSENSVKVESHDVIVKKEEDESAVKEEEDEKSNEIFSETSQLPITNSNETHVVISPSLSSQEYAESITKDLEATKDSTVINPSTSSRKYAESVSSHSESVSETVPTVYKTTDSSETLSISKVSLSSTETPIYITTAVPVAQSIDVNQVDTKGSSTENPYTQMTRDELLADVRGTPISFINLMMDEEKEVPTTTMSSSFISPKQDETLIHLLGISVSDVNSMDSNGMDVTTESLLRTSAVDHKDKMPSEEEIPTTEKPLSDTIENYLKGLSGIFDDEFMDSFDYSEKEIDVDDITEVPEAEITTIKYGPHFSEESGVKMVINSKAMDQLTVDVSTEHAISSTERTTSKDNMETPAKDGDELNMYTGVTETSLIDKEGQELIAEKAFVVPDQNTFVVDSNTKAAEGVNVNIIDNQSSNNESRNEGGEGSVYKISTVSSVNSHFQEVSKQNGNVGVNFVKTTTSDKIPFMVQRSDKDPNNQESATNSYPVSNATRSTIEDKHIDSAKLEKDRPPFVIEGNAPITKTTQSTNTPVHIRIIVKESSSSLDQDISLNNEHYQHMNFDDKTVEATSVRGVESSFANEDNVGLTTTRAITSSNLSLEEVLKQEVGDNDIEATTVKEEQGLHLEKQFVKENTTSSTSGATASPNQVIDENYIGAIQSKDKQASLDFERSASTGSNPKLHQEFGQSYFDGTTADEHQTSVVGKKVVQEITTLSKAQSNTSMEHNVGEKYVEEAIVQEDPALVAVVEKFSTENTTSSTTESNVNLKQESVLVVEKKVVEQSTTLNVKEDQGVIEKKVVDEVTVSSTNESDASLKQELVVVEKKVVEESITSSTTESDASLKQEVGGKCEEEATVEKKVVDEATAEEEADVKQDQAVVDQSTSSTESYENLNQEIVRKYVQNATVEEDRAVVGKKVVDEILASSTSESDASLVVVEKKVVEESTTSRTTESDVDLKQVVGVHFEKATVKEDQAVVEKKVVDEVTSTSTTESDASLKQELVVVEKKVLEQSTNSTITESDASLKQESEGKYVEATVKQDQAVVEKKVVDEVTATSTTESDASLNVEVIGVDEEIEKNYVGEAIVKQDQAVVDQSTSSTESYENLNQEIVRKYVQNATVEEDQAVVGKKVVDEILASSTSESDASLVVVEKKVVEESTTSRTTESDVDLKQVVGVHFEEATVKEDQAVVEKKVVEQSTSTIESDAIQKQEVLVAVENSSTSSTTKPNASLAQEVETKDDVVVGNRIVEGKTILTTTESNVINNQEMIYFKEITEGPVTIAHIDDMLIEATTVNGIETVNEDIRDISSKTTNISLQEPIIEATTIKEIPVPLFNGNVNEVEVDTTSATIPSTTNRNDNIANLLGDEAESTEKTISSHDLSIEATTIKETLSSSEDNKVFDSATEKHREQANFVETTSTKEAQAHSIAESTSLTNQNVQELEGLSQTPPESKHPMKVHPNVRPTTTTTEIPAGVIVYAVTPKSSFRATTPYPTTPTRRSNSKNPQHFAPVTVGKNRVNLESESLLNHYSENSNIQKIPPKKVVILNGNFDHTDTPIIVQATHVETSNFGNSKKDEQVNFHTDAPKIVEASQKNNFGSESSSEEHTQFYNGLQKVEEIRDSTVDDQAVSKKDSKLEENVSLQDHSFSGQDLGVIETMGSSESHQKTASSEQTLQNGDKGQEEAQINEEHNLTKLEELLNSSVGFAYEQAVNGSLGTNYKQGSTKYENFDVNSNQEPNSQQDSNIYFSLDSNYEQDRKGFNETGEANVNHSHDPTLQQHINMENVSEVEVSVQKQANEEANAHSEQSSDAQLEHDENSLTQVTSSTVSNEHINTENMSEVEVSVQKQTNEGANINSEQSLNTQLEHDETSKSRVTSSTVSNQHNQKIYYTRSELINELLKNRGSSESSKATENQSDEIADTRIEMNQSIFPEGTNQPSEHQYAEETEDLRTGELNIQDMIRKNLNKDLTDSIEVKVAFQNNDSVLQPQETQSVQGSDQSNFNSAVNEFETMIKSEPSTNEDDSKDTVIPLYMRNKATGFDIPVQESSSGMEKNYVLGLDGKYAATGTVVDSSDSHEIYAKSGTRNQQEPSFSHQQISDIQITNISQGQVELKGVGLSGVPATLESGDNGGIIKDINHIEGQSSTFISQESPSTLLKNSNDQNESFNLNTPTKDTSIQILSQVSNTSSLEANEQTSGVSSLEGNKSRDHENSTAFWKDQIESFVKTVNQPEDTDHKSQDSKVLPKTSSGDEEDEVENVDKLIEAWLAGRTSTTESTLSLFGSGENILSKEKLVELEPKIQESVDHILNNVKFVHLSEKGLSSTVASPQDASSSRPLQSESIPNLDNGGSSSITKSFSAVSSSSSAGLSKLSNKGEEAINNGEERIIAKVKPEQLDTKIQDSVGQNLDDVKFVQSSENSSGSNATSSFIADTSSSLSTESNTDFVKEGESLVLKVRPDELDTKIQESVEHNLSEVKFVKFSETGSKVTSSPNANESSSLDTESFVGGGEKIVLKERPEELDTKIQESVEHIVNNVKFVHLSENGLTSTVAPPQDAGSARPLPTESNNGGSSSVTKSFSVVSSSFSSGLSKLSNKGEEAINNGEERIIAKVKPEQLDTKIQDSVGNNLNDVKFVQSSENSSGSNATSSFIADTSSSLSTESNTDFVKEGESLVLKVRPDELDTKIQESIEHNLNKNKVKFVHSSENGSGSSESSSVNTDESSSIAPDSFVKEGEIIVLKVRPEELDTKIQESVEHNLNEVQFVKLSETGSKVTSSLNANESSSLDTESSTGGGAIIVLKERPEELYIQEFAHPSKNGSGSSVSSSLNADESSSVATERFVEGGERIVLKVRPEELDTKIQESAEHILNKVKFVHSSESGSGSSVSSSLNADESSSSATESFIGGGEMIVLKERPEERDTKIQESVEHNLNNVKLVHFSENGSGSNEFSSLNVDESSSLATESNPGFVVEEEKRIVLNQKPEELDIKIQEAIEHNLNMIKFAQSSENGSDSSVSSSLNVDTKSNPGFVVESTSSHKESSTHEVSVEQSIASVSGSQPQSGTFSTATPSQEHVSQVESVSQTQTPYQENSNENINNGYQILQQNHDSHSNEMDRVLLNQASVVQSVSDVSAINVKEVSATNTDLGVDSSHLGLISHSVFQTTHIEPSSSKETVDLEKHTLDNIESQIFLSENKLPSQIPDVNDLPKNKPSEFSVSYSTSISKSQIPSAQKPTLSKKAQPFKPKDKFDFLERQADILTNFHDLYVERYVAPSQIESRKVPIVLRMNQGKGKSIPAESLVFRSGNEIDSDSDDDDSPSLTPTQIQQIQKLIKAKNTEDLAYFLHEENLSIAEIPKPVLVNAIRTLTAIVNTLESTSSTTTSTTTTDSTTTVTSTTTPATTTTTSTTRRTTVPTTPVPSTSTVPYYVMTVTPETVIENANSVDFERENIFRTTPKPKERPSATVERNLELLQELLALQAKIAKQNARKSTHVPVTSTEGTTSSTTVTTTSSSTTTKPTTTTQEPTTRRLTTKTATKSTFSDDEDLAFLENLKKAINQQKTTRKTTTTSTSTQAPTTYMEDLYNSFQSATPSTLKKSTFSDQEDLDFLNKLRQLGKINVTTPQSPTFANRVIELAAQQRNRTTTPITTTSTTSKTTSKTNYDFKKDEAQLGQDLALLSTLLGRRISAEDIPKLNQQFQSKGRQPIQTTTKTTTTTTTEATKRPMTNDELAEVNKNLKLLSSILGRPIAIEELPTIMKQYRFGRNPTVPTTTTTTTTTTPQPIINSNTPITRDEVIELLKDPEVGLGDNIDTYGKTNDAILAAVLKQKGIGPVHNNVPVDDLFLQGPTATPYATTRRPPRGRQPILSQPQQQQQGNPLFSGLSWLWRTWQETAPGTQPNRAPYRANRNSQPQADRLEEGAESDVESPPEDVPTAYPQGGGLLAAAFGVTRAVTQFLGAALQGAAKTVQQSWNTREIDNPFATSG